MFPGECFVLSPVGERIALDPLARLDWSGMTLVWLDCFDGGEHLATIGLNRQAMQ